MIYIELYSLINGSLVEKIQMYEPHRTQRHRSEEQGIEEQCIRAKNRREKSRRTAILPCIWV